jgi:drug/metabolite transporter (DMT)-like permease
MAAVFWAAASLLATRVSRSHGADPVLFWGLAVGGAVPAVAALATEQLRYDTSDLVRLSIAGFGLVVAWWAFALGVTHGGVAGVVAVSATDGAIAATVALLLGERLSAAVLASLAVVVVGVLVVSGSGAGTSIGRMAPKAVGFGLLSACGYATFLVATGGLDRIGPLWATAVARGAALLMVGPLLLVRGRLAIPWRDTALVALAGAVTSLGVVCYLLAVTDGIAVPSVMASSYAAWTALGGVLLMGERVHRGQVLGMAAVVVGMAGLALARA